MITAAKTTSHRAASGSTPAGRIARTLVGAFASAWTVMRNRRQIRALEDLDDWLLADMGLTRADLRDAYRTPLLQDSSLRLAVTVEAQHRPAATARIRGRRGDAHAPTPPPVRMP